MPQLLELAQLAQPHHMAQVDIGAGGVEALLEAEHLPCLQELAQLGLHDNLGHATAQ